MRSMRFVALLAIPTQIAFAQQTAPQGGSLSLDAAIGTARRNNATFHQAENNVRTAQAQLREQYGQLLPQANASLFTSYQQGGTQYIQGLPFAGPDAYNSSYSLSVRMGLSPSSLYAPRAARAQRDAAEADVTNQSEVLRSTVTTQYITALQSEAQAALNDTLVQVQQGNLQLVQAQLSAGAATIVDVRAAEVQLGQAQVDALTAHNQAQIDKLTLYQTMGTPADINATLTTKFSTTPPPFSLDSLVALALQVNPDLAARKSLEFASDMNVKVARSQYLPSLGLSTGYGANAYGYSNSDFAVSQAQAQAVASRRSCLSQDSLRVGAGLDPLQCGNGTLTDADIARVRSSNQPLKFNKSPFSVSASLSMPIFNGFAREANIEQARINRENASYDVKNRTLQVTTDVTRFYLTLMTDAKKVELQTSTAAKAAEELAGKQERYKVGAATFLDVMVANGQYQTAQIGRVNAIYEYHKAFAALENAVGRPLR